MARLMSALRVAAPRVIALVWAAWSAATAYAYLGGAPPQLARVESVLPFIEVWHLWAMSTVLLIVGALIPGRVHSRLQDLAGWFRIIGLAMIAGLLAMWAVEFFTADARGWVSGKNYLLLAMCTLTHAWWIGKHRAPGGDAS